MMYDFFIAHAGPDIGAAESLYGLLTRARARVFLDSISLRPGDAWDDALPEALNSAGTTVVLISRRTEMAFYQREEVSAAIARSRLVPTVHRVVPVYLEVVDDVPYGLRRLHSLRAYGSAGLRRCSKELLGLLSHELAHGDQPQ